MTRRHGTRAKYSAERCRCDACRAANNRYAKWRQVTGNVDLVDAAPAREHIAALRAAGIGRRTIAARSGVAESVITRITGVDKSRPARRVRRSTLSAILAVTAEPPDGTPVDGNGTRLRLRALVAIGWTQRELAQRLGWTDSNFSSLIHGRRHRNVSAGTRDAVIRLYEALSMTPGSSARSRARAAANGWVPSLGLDDDRIDDPTYTPDPGVARRDRAYTAREDVLELLALGETHAAIAARLGISEAAVDRARYGRSA